MWPTVCQPEHLRPRTRANHVAQKSDPSLIKPCLTVSSTKGTVVARAAVSLRPSALRGPGVPRLVDICTWECLHTCTYTRQRGTKHVDTNRRAKNKPRTKYRQSDTYRTGTAGECKSVLARRSCLRSCTDTGDSTA